MWVIDLASGNGTRVSGQPVNCATVALGKSLQVGEHRFHFLRLHTDDVTETIVEQRDGLSAGLVAQQTISNDLERQRTTLLTTLLALHEELDVKRKDADMQISQLAKLVADLEVQVDNN